MVVVILAAAHVYQHVKRRQAEKLLAEISGLELRRATFEDAQKLAQEWQRYVTTSPNCNVQRCKITITLADYRAYPIWLFNPPWLARLVLRTGLRPAQMEAAIGVRDGIVWSKHFGIQMYVRNLSYPDAWPLTLMADASTVSKFGAYFEDNPQLRLHPHYIVGKPGGCDGPCVLAYAKFTPYADPSDARRLMQINLACLTSWTPCQSEADILPQPWTQYEKELPAIWQARDPHSCDASDLELLGRDAEQAGIVQITAVDKSLDGNSYFKVRARMIHTLKKGKSWPDGSEAEFTIDDRSIFSPEIGLQKGSDVILLFGAWPEIQVNRCGLVPFNPKYLKKVGEGITQDFLSPEIPAE